jgi:hypothetical protein
MHLSLLHIKSYIKEELWCRDYNGNSMRLGTVRVKERNTFLILSCTPFCLQNNLNLLGRGLYKLSKAFHRDTGPCWLQSFPQLCQIVWMSFGWWTILDTHRKLLCEKPSSVAVLDTLKPVCLAPTTIQYPVQRHLNSLSLPISPLNGTHTHNPSLTCLLSFIYTDWI